MSSGYQPRTYRADQAAEDLVPWRIVVEETDLHIQAELELWDSSRQATRTARGQVEREIARRPEFSTSLQPLYASENAEEVTARMYAATAVAGVGPMAAVAGAIAQYVGEALAAGSGQVLVENGGDVYLNITRERVIALGAGQSPLSGRVGLVAPAGFVGGVCTSSGTVGHSYSAGRADAAVIVAADAAFADAAATALGNRVQLADDAEAAVQWALSLPGVEGALVVIGATLAAGGKVELRRIDES